MAKRQFKDERGIEWVVWDVHPADIGRTLYDRRGSLRAEAAADSPRLVHPDLQQGWLCFLAGSDKRRFAPIPPNWEQLPDSVLRVMLDVASPAPHTGTRAPNTTTLPVAE